MVPRLIAPRAATARPNALVREKSGSKAIQTSSMSARHLPNARTSYAPLHSSDQRLFQEGGGSRQCRGASLHVLQFCTLANDPGDGRWRDRQFWEISDIVALIEAKEAEQPKVRGPYKKRREEFEVRMGGQSSPVYSSNSLRGCGAAEFRGNVHLTRKHNFAYRLLWFN